MKQGGADEDFPLDLPLSPVELREIFVAWREEAFRFADAKNKRVGRPIGLTGKQVENLLRGSGGLPGHIALNLYFAFPSFRARVDERMARARRQGPPAPAPAPMAAPAPAADDPVDLILDALANRLGQRLSQR